MKAWMQLLAAASMTAAALVASLPAAAQEATPDKPPTLRPRMGPGNTMGWPMMNAEERTAHRAKMRDMKTYEECNAYREEHHKQMMERAKAQGRTLPAAPRRDMCAGMPKK
jgi:hypothetical protein